MFKLIVFSTFLILARVSFASGTYLLPPDIETLKELSEDLDDELTNEEDNKGEKSSEENTEVDNE